MDVAAAGIKFVDVLKVMPTWLLIGLCFSLLCIWLWPPFLTLLPEYLSTKVPMLLTVVSILAACNMSSLFIGYVVNRHRKRLDRDRERLLNLYRPLNSLFLTRHITVSEVTVPLRMRLTKVVEELNSPKGRLKRALRALLDKQLSSSAEVEFGGDFPLGKIIDLLNKNAEYAQPALSDLVRRADRSRYENYGQALLTDEEFALFEHIDSEHRRLSARLR
jgi:hypothetical protein